MKNFFESKYKFKDYLTTILTEKVIEVPMKILIEFKEFISYIYGSSLDAFFWKSIQELEKEDN